MSIRKEKLAAVALDYVVKKKEVAKLQVALENVDTFPINDIHIGDKSS